MQNLSLSNKNSTQPPCCQNTMSKNHQDKRSKDVQILKPECLIVNIESVQQVSFHNTPTISQRPKTLRNIKGERPMTSQNVPKNLCKKCILSTNEYARLIERSQKENSNNDCDSKYSNLSEKSNRNVYNRPKTEHSQKFCTVCCDDYVKLVIGEKNNLESSYSNTKEATKQERFGRLNSQNTQSIDLKALEEDRWNTTYELAFTWK